MGEILVGLGVLREPDVGRVLEAQGWRRRRPKFGRVALAMGLLRPEHVLAALAVQMDLFPGIDRLSVAEILCRLQ